MVGLGVAVIALVIGGGWFIWQRRAARTSGAK